MKKLFIATGLCLITGIAMSGPTAAVRADSSKVHFPELGKSGGIWCSITSKSGAYASYDLSIDLAGAVRLDSGSATRSDYKPEQIAKHGSFAEKAKDAIFIKHSTKLSNPTVADVKTWCLNDMPALLKESPSFVGSTDAFFTVYSGSRAKNTAKLYDQSNYTGSFPMNVPMK